jgi:hypothetical protein
MTFVLVICLSEKIDRLEKEMLAEESYCNYGKEQIQAQMDKHM